MTSTRTVITTEYDDAMRELARIDVPALEAAAAAKHAEFLSVQMGVRHPSSVALQDAHAVWNAAENAADAARQRKADLDRRIEKLRREVDADDLVLELRNDVADLQRRDAELTESRAKIVAVCDGLAAREDANFEEINRLRNASVDALLEGRTDDVPKMLRDLSVDQETIAEAHVRACGKVEVLDRTQAAARDALNGKVNELRTAEANLAARDQANIVAPIVDELATSLARQALARDWQFETDRVVVEIPRAAFEAACRKLAAEDPLVFGQLLSRYEIEPLTDGPLESLDDTPTGDSAVDEPATEGEGYGEAPADLMPSAAFARI